VALWSKNGTVFGQKIFLVGKKISVNSDERLKSYGRKVGWLTSQVENASIQLLLDTEKAKTTFFFSIGLLHIDIIQNTSTCYINNR
jgi:hypothetical protein